ncbi:hypothetical protein N658DRAFT_519863 [Parathielavia hyrcaniae]|uniref:Uncharacterized protein n=1 Tax=Parathielavia hyrcaniae TaxID=113614 RepID=A0AAN6QF38_9PEZI|nr:hypothetical protein N658DRAFT_519863 [Parathielavia hyrcaniae]
MARVINSNIWFPDDCIEPPCSVLTGEPIPSFPRSVGEIENLDMEQVDTILDHLEVPKEGGLEDRRRKIKAICGVVAESSSHTRKNSGAVGAEADDNMEQQPWEKATENKELSRWGQTWAPGTGVMSHGGNGAWDGFGAIGNCNLNGVYDWGM